MLAKREPISVQERVITHRPGYTTTTDHSLFGEYSRTVYLTGDAELRLPETSHSHNSEHIFVLVNGEAELRLWSGDEVNTIVLTTDKIYKLSGNITHQLKVAPSTLLESYYPALGWQNSRLVSGPQFFQRPVREDMGSD